MNGEIRETYAVQCKGFDKLHYYPWGSEMANGYFIDFKAPEKLTETRGLLDVLILLVFLVQVGHTVGIAAA